MQIRPTGVPAPTFGQVGGTAQTPNSNSTTGANNVDDGLDTFVPSTQNPDEGNDTVPRDEAQCKKWGGFKTIFGKVKDAIKKVLNIVADSVKAVVDFVWNGQPEKPNDPTETPGS